MEKQFLTVFRIDERVFFTMGLCSLMAVVVFAYRFKNNKPCELVTISFNAADFYAGSVIYFKAYTMNGETYKWDFGDNSKLNIAGPTTTHAYQSPGNYRVYITVNGECRDQKNIIIKERPIVMKEEFKLAFVCPDTAYMNRSVTFADTTHHAVKWEWFFDESGRVNDTGRKATWVFPTAGFKTVYLRINGRQDMAGSKKIRVIDWNRGPGSQRERPPAARAVRPVYIQPRPTDSPLNPIPPPPAEEKLAPEIQGEEMELFLREVVTGNRTAASFSKYLCENLNVPVNYNNESITFTEMCNRLKGFKKLNRINTLSVWKLSRNKSTGCIMSVSVTVTKKGFFGRVLVK